MHPEAHSSNKLVLVLVAVLGVSGDTTRSAVAQEAKPDKLLITSLRQHHGPDLVTQIFRVNADGSDRAFSFADFRPPGSSLTCSRPWPT
jgi:hypothetical protein